MFLKILQISQENTCVYTGKYISLFNKRDSNRDSNLGVFLWNLRNFEKHLLTSDSIKI